MAGAAVALGIVAAALILAVLRRPAQHQPGHFRDLFILGLFLESSDAAPAFTAAIVAIAAGYDTILFLLIALSLAITRLYAIAKSEGLKGKSNSPQ